MKYLKVGFNIRKVFVTFFLVFVSTIKIFADGGSLFSDISGSYAIYHDLRFNDEAIIGVCYIGEDTVLTRSYEPKTGNELLLMVDFVVNKNEIEHGNNIKVLKGSFTSSEAASRLLPMLLNWANTWYKSKDKINQNMKYSVSTDDDYSYLSWIPVFQIDTIGTKKDFTVFTVGFLKDLSDERFFGITKLPSPIKSDKYKIKKGKSQNVEIDGLLVPLDSNWETEDKRIYRINKKTPQDAAFLIETINYTESGFSSISQLAKLLLIGTSDVVVLTEGSSISVEKGTYNLYIRMFDPVQNKVTVQQTQLIERGDGYVSIATLACYETLYLQNKDYFDKILH